jgi:hypothetical protein
LMAGGCGYKAAPPHCTLTAEHFPPEINKQKYFNSYFIYPPVYV